MQNTYDELGDLMIGRRAALEHSSQRLKSAERSDPLKENELSRVADFFTRKMSQQTEMREAYMKKQKEKMMTKVRSYHSEKEKKRLKAIESTNIMKREEIQQNLEKIRLSATKREAEIKYRNEEYEHIKRTLSPELDKIKHEQWEEEMNQFRDTQLNRRKSYLKPVKLDDLRHHSTRVDIVLKQRQIKDLLNTSNTIPREYYDPLKFKKHQKNDYFLKQLAWSSNKKKSLKYADKVQSNFLQQSSRAAIVKWEHGKERKNFGYYYRQNIKQRQSDKLREWDPHSYLQESIQVGKRDRSVTMKKMASKSLGNLEEEKPKTVTYKEMLAREVNFSKVNDEKLNNKELNKFERLERAKRYISEQKLNIKISPAVCMVDEMAEECIRSRNPNVFKKYINTIQYLEEKTRAREQLELFEKKISKPVITVQGKADSIDLLSSCIKSKLKLLGNT